MCSSTSSAFIPVLLARFSCISGITTDQCIHQAFGIIVRLRQESIYARIQSRHRKPSRRPTAQRQPLHRQLALLESCVTRQNHAAHFVSSTESLRAALQDVDRLEPAGEDGISALKRVVKACHDFCTSRGHSVQETLHQYGLDPDQASRLPIVKSIEKVGHYFRICQDLIRASKHYSVLFKSLVLDVLPSFQKYTPLPMTSEGKISYRVHAEIQILIFYDLQSPHISLKPRVIGASKGACYLCNRFIYHHGSFFISKAHGRIYPKWNLPDLAIYSQEQRMRYQKILHLVNNDMLGVASKVKGKRHPDPMESYVFLPSKFLPSSASSLATLLSAQMHQRRPSSVIPAKHSDIEGRDSTVSPISKATLNEATGTVNSIPLDVPGEQFSEGPCNESLDGKTTNIAEDPSKQIGSSKSSSRSSANAQHCASTPSCSSVSVPLPLLPVHQTVSSSRPLHLKLSNLYLIIEVEPTTTSSSPPLQKPERSEQVSIEIHDLDCVHLVPSSCGQEHGQSHTSAMTFLDLLTIQTDQTLEFGIPDPAEAATTEYACEGNTLHSTRRTFALDLKHGTCSYKRLIVIIE